MIIKCKRCGTTCGNPQATGGIFTILPAALITGVACAFLVAEIKGWAFLAAIPLWFILTWVLWEFPRWITFLRYGLRDCPKCGARSWERPEYSGFGL